MLKPIRIGSMMLDSNILLAPLAGISDSSFRLICREGGAGFTFLEMINACALSHKSKKTKKMLLTAENDKPIGIQLLGQDEDMLLRAVDIIQGYSFDLLDFNVACPVKKVCRRGEGAALMKDPKKLEIILKSIRKKWDKPFSIKIRSGWDQNSQNAPEISQLAQDCGLNAVFVHGRDRNQFYKGFVDYAVIKNVKKNLHIPVIASGDILSAELSEKMFLETGCDGILVARGALGHPWIFKEITDYLGHKKLPEPKPISEILDVLSRHLELCINEHGEDKAISLMRKFVGWYLKGRRFVRPIREKTSRLKTKKDFLEILEMASSLADL